MKKLVLFIFCQLSFFIFLSCENDNHISSPLIGKWFDTIDYSRYIEFNDDSNVIINSREYSYNINLDSIYFEYNGIMNHYFAPIFIYCPGSVHKIRIDYSNQILEIENLNWLCFINGDTGITVFSRRIRPNKFIGKWITTDFTDTLFFKTNDFLEHPGIYHSSGFKYSYTNDSLTIQYNGPDKIYIPADTFKYNFTGDTLSINFYKDYYPNITKGTKKFLREE